MERREIVNNTIGALLILAGVSVNIFEPAWVLSVTGVSGGLVGAGLAMVAVNYIGKSRRGDNRPDERDFEIAERSAYRSFQVTFPVTGFFMAFLGLTKFNFPAEPSVSLIFALMGVSYGAAFFYYRRRL